jgi:hypothetical protein
MIFSFYLTISQALDSDRDAVRTSDQGGAKGGSYQRTIFPFRELTPSCPAQ